MSLSVISATILAAFSACNVAQHKHKQPTKSLPIIQHAEASWYNDAGQTACGFHAYFGVANRTLACGTRVTFYYGSRAVRSIVDDRGPFIYSRLWDLNQNTAGTLGFNGLGTVGYRLCWCG